MVISICLALKPIKKFKKKGYIHLHAPFNHKGKKKKDSHVATCDCALKWIAQR